MSIVNCTKGDHLFDNDIDVEALYPGAEIICSDHYEPMDRDFYEWMTSQDLHKIDDLSFIEFAEAAWKAATLKAERQGTQTKPGCRQNDNGDKRNANQ